jgi:hypothetical protein
MFTIRNLGGTALLLFGSTFLWLTPTFAAQGVDTIRLMWRLLAMRMGSWTPASARWVNREWRS